MHHPSFNWKLPCPQFPPHSTPLPGNGNANRWNSQGMVKRYSNTPVNLHSRSNQGLQNDLFQLVSGQSAQLKWHRELALQQGVVGQVEWDDEGLVKCPPPQPPSTCSFSSLRPSDKGSERRRTLAVCSEEGSWCGRWPKSRWPTDGTFLSCVLLPLSVCQSSPPVFTLPLLLSLVFSSSLSVMINVTLVLYGLL